MPQQRRAQATVETLLQATARVLLAKGWAGTTTNHIALRAGVSVGTLYEYFPGKEALVAALVERHLNEAEARLGELVSSFQKATLTLEEMVGAMVALMIDLHAGAPRLHRVLFEEVPLGPQVRRRIRETEDASAATLAAILPRLCRVADPKVTSRVVVELLEALTHRWIAATDAELLPRERMQAELERLILAYVRSG